jgi:putative SOS response-associated peptidase YedK
MCSRFELNAHSRDLAGRFGWSVPPLSGEFRPTDPILVIGPAGAMTLRWGLAVDWDAKPLINARAETLDSRPTFRPLLGRRVLVPATGWFEWRKDGRFAIKTRITPGDGAILGLAGLSDGQAVTIVTVAAAPGLDAIHDRMPAVLDRGDEEGWLDPNRPFSEISSALKPSGRSFTAEPPPAPPRQPDLFG